MTRPRRIPLGLSLACLLLALVQRPGDVVADTKVDLYVDPQGFLGEVLSAWTTQAQLGHVFGGQYGGYLFPMAPWFALGDLLGVPTWIVHRLWLGAVLALAAWGVVRLLDALLDRPRGAPHAAAAVLFVLNPYVAVYANRTSIALLAYAALPWLLLAVHRGLRAPRSWRWPALFALVLTCTGGGVNLAVTGWVLLGPLLFVVYERLFGGVGRGAIVPFVLRLAPVVLLANAWWLAPAAVHFRYGLDFLPFTEQPGTIWQTTSVTESLRLMGFWTSYIGLGFGGELRPFASHGAVMLFHPAVVVASLLVPAIVLGGFAWTSRWRYGPWFLLLALAGLTVMVLGFPDGTPLRRAVTFTYNQAEPLRFLRTSYKAGPLLALGLAALGGVLFGIGWDRLQRGGRAALAGGALALCAVAAWPLTTGTAPERQLVFDVPRWWQDGAREVDRMPAGRRAMVLPGRLFGYSDWGGTIDPILPVLADRPAAERMLVPFADLRSVDLQFAADALVSQERAVPGQLSPLLDLMAVGRVLTPADHDRARSGAVGAVEAADVLAGEPALAAQAPLELGPRETERAADGRVRDDADLPRVTVRGASTGGLVRVLPRRPLTVVDGGAEGVAALAAFGGLDPRRPLAYAADLDAQRIRTAARQGGEVVITDTNRRQAFVAARMRANRGRVLTAGEELSQDGAMLDPFDRGPDAQTVSVLSGVAGLEAPFSPQTPQYPEHRPFAAVDGDPSTAWLADRALALDRHWIEVRFTRPVDLGAIDVLPYSDERGRVLDLIVDGEEVAVRPGWNRIRVDRRGARSLRIAVDDVSSPPGVSGGAGGISEIRIPGVRVDEVLRPPVLAERALARGPVNGPLTYLLSRMTTDAPGRTAPPPGPFQAYVPRDRVDPEPRLIRTIAPPVPRTWEVDAWVRPAPAAPDPVVDRLAGTSGTVRATSSARQGGLAAHRASRAFDADPSTAWVAPWVDPGRAGRQPGARMTLVLESAAAVRRLRLVPSRPTVRRPVRVRLAAGGDAVTAPVGARGDVVLPRTLRGERVELTVLDARFPADASGLERRRRAVGIAEVQGIEGARVRDRAPASALRSRCGDATVHTAAGPVALAPKGTVRDLEAGRPLRAADCGFGISLPAGRQRVAGGRGPLDVDQVRLRSSVPRAPGTTPPAGRVLDQGEDGQGEREGVRVAVDGPAWLVLGESYNAGWRATCDGRDLGEPAPMQAFANAWPVERGCRDVAFTWAPNRVLPPAYWLSLIASLVLLAVLVAGRRRPVAASGVRPMPTDEPVWRRPWPRAAAAGVVAAVVLGFVFAIRAGLVLGPLVALVLALGVPARRLALAAGALLGIVVPILYLAVPVRDPGGYNSNLAVDRIAAHWVAVVAVVLLGAALWRVLAASRTRS